MFHVASSNLTDSVMLCAANGRKQRVDRIGKYEQIVNAISATVYTHQRGVESAKRKKRKLIFAGDIRLQLRDLDLKAAMAEIF